MDIKVFETNVVDLMEKWNLPAMGWKWEYNNLKRTLGLCNYREKKLFFSTAFIPINPPEIIIDVIKHEIAHALAPRNSGHGYLWKLKAIEVGAVPRSCQSQSVSPEGKYYFECTTCNMKHHFHRRPKYEVRICNKCRSRVFMQENRNVCANTGFLSTILERVQ